MPATIRTSFTSDKNPTLKTEHTRRERSIEAARPEFFCCSLVLELICYWTTVNRLLNDKKARKILTSSEQSICFLKLAHPRAPVQFVSGEKGTKINLRKLFSFGLSRFLLRKGNWDPFFPSSKSQISGHSHIGLRCPRFRLLIFVFVIFISAAESLDYFPAGFEFRELCNFKLRRRPLNFQCFLF